MQRIQSAYQPTIDRGCVVRTKGLFQMRLSHLRPLQTCKLRKQCNSIFTPEDVIRCIRNLILPQGGAIAVAQSHPQPAITCIVFNHIRLGGRTCDNWNRFMMVKDIEPENNVTPTIGQDQTAARSVGSIRPKRLNTPRGLRCPNGFVISDWYWNMRRPLMVGGELMAKRSFCVACLS